MSRTYDHRAIEQKWQAYWERHQTFRVSEDPARPKFYCLEMFPYPSGRIHMGHVRNYAIGDVLARYKRMRGFNVLHPMGWDAFGLPAENAAIERGVHPRIWTEENIQSMRRQLRHMGLSYDWTRELGTYLPEYYRWNQWFFLKMYERGLAYRKRSAVNWCPQCETVLANEQVEEGLCWRCEAAVVQKDLEQWFLKITQYAEQLLDAAETLCGWPDRVLAMQRHWIGRSVGVDIDFPLAEPAGGVEVVRVFTTRQDTVYGATFMSLAPESPLVEPLIAGRPEAPAVRDFVQRVSRQDKALRTAIDRDKEGVFTGAWAINPFTGERIPIWVANFVLYEYGTGAVMAVPAHDQRDFAFARKYDIPVRLAIQNPEGSLDEGTLEGAYEEQEAAGARLVHAERFTGLPVADAKERIAEYVEAMGLGRRTVNYRLRDWGISRQRYWGTPIPIVYCDGCGVVAVPEHELPVTLPSDVPFTGKGASPLAQVKRFVDIACPKCRRPARRETDTMDTFVDSSWYFLRYCSPQEKARAIDPAAADYWMAVDQYIGGIEHAVLHLLYARFFTKVIRDLGLTKVDEPFMNLLTQGMVTKQTIRCERHGWLFPSETIASDGGGRCAKCEAEGRVTPVERGRTEKMSKSRKNVVDPEHLIASLGADTARMFSLFAAPPEKDLEWSDTGVEGASRFLQRVWRLIGDLKEHLGRQGLTGRDGESRAREIRRFTHRTIKKVTEDIDREFQFNTAVAALMEFVNGLYKLAADGAKEGRTAEEAAALGEAANTLVLLLAPFAPHIAEELWERLDHAPSVADQPWPAYDHALLASERLTIPIQVNGKLRSRIEVPADATEEQVVAEAQRDVRLLEWLQGKTPRKVVYVPKKLVNFVV